MKKEALYHAFAETIFATFPLLIFAIVLQLLNLGWDDFKVLPEWSFIATIIYYECFRDTDKLKKLNYYKNDEHISVHKMLFVLMVVSLTVFIFAFLNTKTNIVNENYLVPIQLLVAALSIITCFISKYSLNSKEISNTKMKADD